MDLSITIKDKFNIAKEINFSRKRVRVKYYPSKKEETDQIDLFRFVRLSTFL